MKRLLLIIWFCLWAQSAFAVTAWVDTNGAAAWGDCQGAEKTGASACSYSTANTNADAGDTVNFQGGTYTINSGNGIDPTNSGSSGNVITFTAYNSESVEFVATHSNGIGVHLNNDDYIKVHGIKFSDWYKPLRITSGEYNEISYSTFEGCCGGDQTQGDWVGSRIRTGSTYNWVHGCSFSNYGYFDPNDNNVVFGVGIEETNDGSMYNLIEDNHFFHGGHHVVDVNGKLNVWRNNYIRNDAWSNYGGTDYSNRVLFTAGSWSTHNIGRTLFEGNRVAYGQECADDEVGGSGGSWSSDYHIVRHNVFYQNYLYGMYIVSYTGLTASYMRIYNNTFWYNGHSPTGPLKGYWGDDLSHGLTINEDADTVDNHFVNNLFYDNQDDCSGSPGPLIESNCTVPDNQTLRNNWTSGDPSFVDISGTPTPSLIETQFDFTLQPSSGAIDNGGRLTDVATGDDCNGGTGCDTTVEVDDAGYFFDGWTMAAAIPSATIEADWICIGTVLNCAQISSINYTTNVITLASALDRNDGDDVWLYKDSEGTQVLYGTTPDQGAYEYGAGSTPTNTITGVNIN